MLILRSLCPACQTRTMLARITSGPLALTFEHSNIRMSRLRSHPPARGRVCRSDEIQRSCRLAPGRIASANVRPPQFVLRPVNKSVAHPSYQTAAYIGPPMRECGTCHV
jgi:hypothetical protein